MTKKFNLKAEIRKDDEKISEIKKNGFVPGVIYGGKKPNQNLKINKNQFIKIYEGAGESSLLDLEIDKGDNIKVIIKDTQQDPVKGEIQHVDFFRVDMNVPIEIEIPFNFIGTGKTVKDLGAMVLTNLESIHAKCLPGDLIDNIEINLDELKTLEDSIHVRDLDLPENIELLTDVNSTIVNVALPRQEVEEKPEETEEGSKEEAKEDEKEEKKKEGEPNEDKAKKEKK
jgi:large subunit ribosomal protein L25